jgi:glutamate transport system substrate-binding protein
MERSKRHSGVQRGPTSLRAPRLPPRTVFGLLRRRRRARPFQLGCLLSVLVIAALWLAGRAVETVTALFSDRPTPVAGSPFSTAAPPRPANSGSSTIDRVTRRGKLIVAIGETPGLVQRSNASAGYAGFDIALLGLIARDLGLQAGAIIFKPLPVGNREAALLRGEADLVLGGYEITPQRSARLAIAGPYLVRPLLLAVPTDSPITGLDGLQGRQVCAPADSAAADEMINRHIALRTRESLGACAQLLLDRRVQAIASDQGSIMALRSANPGRLRPLDEPVGSVEYGIGLAPGDPIFRQRIVAVLHRAIADGTWSRFYAEYLGLPVPSPPTPR